MNQRGHYLPKVNAKQLCAMESNSPDFYFNENDFLEVEYEPSYTEKSKKKQKRKSRTENFSFFEKQRLIELVKEKRAIWDLSEKMHCNTPAIDQLWAEIATMLGKTAAECKRAWVALRESYRYHARTAKSKSSGSAGGEYIDSPHFSESASTSFEHDLSFLGDTSQKRKTFQSVENLTTELDAPCSTQYFYEEQPKCKKSKSDKILDECLDIQKKLLEKHSTGAVAENKSFKHTEFWTYVETLIKDLPAGDIVQLQQNFLTSIFQKLSKSNI